MTEYTVADLYTEADVDIADFLLSMLPEESATCWYSAPSKHLDEQKTPHDLQQEQGPQAVESLINMIRDSVY